MKTNKLIVRSLILLGFGGAVGLAGCGGTRAQRSRTASKETPVADTAATPDYDFPVRVLYGIPPSQFNPDGSVRGERPQMLDRTVPPAPAARPDASVPPATPVPSTDEKTTGEGSK